MNVKSGYSNWTPSRVAVLIGLAPWAGDRGRAEARSSVIRGYVFPFQSREKISAHALPRTISRSLRGLRDTLSLARIISADTAVAPSACEIILPWLNVKFAKMSMTRRLK